MFTILLSCWIVSVRVLNGEDHSFFQIQSVQEFFNIPQTRYTLQWELLWKNGFHTSYCEKSLWNATAYCDREVQDYLNRALIQPCLDVLSLIVYEMSVFWCEKRRSFKYFQVKLAFHSKIKRNLKTNNFWSDLCGFLLAFTTVKIIFLFILNFLFLLR